MTTLTYEPIEEDLNSPATKADVEKILEAIEILAERIRSD